MAVGKSQWAWRALVAWAVGNAKACSCLGICLVTFPPATDNDKLDFLLWTLSSSLPNLVLHLNLTAAAATCCWKTLACCGRWPSPLVHDLFLQRFSRPSTLESIKCTVTRNIFEYIEIFLQNSNFSPVHTFLYIPEYSELSPTYTAMRGFEDPALANRGTSGDYQSDGHCPVHGFFLPRPTKKHSVSLLKWLSFSLVLNKINHFSCQEHCYTIWSGSPMSLEINVSGEPSVWKSQ